MTKFKSIKKQRKWVCIINGVNYLDDDILKS